MQVRENGKAVKKPAMVLFIWEFFLSFHLPGEKQGRITRS